MRYGSLILMGCLSLGVAAQERVVKGEAVYVAQARKQMADIPDSARTDEKGLNSLRPYVVQLESMMRWTANDPAWKGRRDAWAQEVLKSRNVLQVSKLLLELETNTSWDAVDAGWKKSRDGWIQKVKAVRSRKALADRLLDYEGNLNWDFMEQDWKGARDGWVENVSNAGNQ